jgi:hypothetical protein
LLGAATERVRAFSRLADYRERPCVEVDRIANTYARKIKGKIADPTALGDEPRELIT